jgi:hypothetical protein
VLLETGGGDIGTAANPINTSTNNITVNIGTQFNGNANVFNNIGNPVTINDSQAGGNFTFVNFGNTGNIVVNNLASGHGSISITALTGGITVNPASIINANGGSLTLQASAGNTILIGANASLNAASTTAGLGNIYISIQPVVLNSSGTPSNITTNTPNGGTIDFGSNGILGNTPNNIITADSKLVAFSTNGGPASSITLGGGVTISARPVSYYLESLDLTDPNTTAQIQALITAGVITGSLQLTTSGIAIGGNITIPQTALIGGLGLSALKIPANVTVQLPGNYTTSPLNINAGPCGNCTQIVQIGTLNFSSATDVSINFGDQNGQGQNVGNGTTLLTGGTHIDIYNPNLKMHYQSLTPKMDLSKAAPAGRGHIRAPRPQGHSATLSATYCSGAANEQAQQPVKDAANNQNQKGGVNNTPPPPVKDIPPPPPIVEPPVKIIPPPPVVPPVVIIPPKIFDKNPCDAFKTDNPQNTPLPNELKPQPKGFLGPQIGQQQALPKAEFNCNATTVFFASLGADHLNSGVMKQLLEKIGVANSQDKDPIPQAMSKYGFQNKGHYDPCGNGGQGSMKLKPGDVIDITYKDGKHTAQHSVTIYSVDKNGQPTYVIQTHGPGLDTVFTGWNAFLSTYNGTSGVNSQMTVYSKP